MCHSGLWNSIVFWSKTTSCNQISWYPHTTLQCAPDPPRTLECTELSTWQKAHSDCSPSVDLRAHHHICILSHKYSQSQTLSYSSWSRTGQCANCTIRAVSVTEVQRLLESINSNSATGSDNIPPRLLKTWAHPQLSPPHPQHCCASKPAPGPAKESVPLPRLQQPR